jgi:hypothetical protein
MAAEVIKKERKAGNGIGMQDPSHRRKPKNGMS